MRSLLVAGALVIAGAFIAPSIDAHASTIHNGDVSASVEKTTTRNMSSYARPQKGNKFVSYLIHIENDSDDKITISPGSFDLEDSDGFRYDNTYSSIARPSFTVVTIRSGKEYRGWISYEIPRDAHITGMVWSVGYNDIRTIPLDD